MFHFYECWTNGEFLLQAFVDFKCSNFFMQIEQTNFG